MPFNNHPHNSDILEERKGFLILGRKQHPHVGIIFFKYFECVNMETTNFSKLFFWKTKPVEKVRCDYTTCASCMYFGVCLLLIFFGGKKYNINQLSPLSPSRKLNVRMMHTTSQNTNICNEMSHVLFNDVLKAYRRQMIKTKYNAIIRYNFHNYWTL